MKMSKSPQNFSSRVILMMDLIICSQILTTEIVALGKRVGQYDDRWVLQIGRRPESRCSWVARHKPSRINEYQHRSQY